MAKTRKFSTYESRNAYIVASKKSGKTTEEISDEVDLSSSQVNRICKAHKQNGRLTRKKGSGRPKILTKAHKLKLLKAAGRHFGRSVQDMIDECNIPCSDETARGYLKSMGYTFKKSQKMPYLEYEDEQARLVFGQTYMDYDFSTTIFVDESVFQVGQSYYGWSKSGQPAYIGTSNFAPKIGVWASISMFGKLSLTFYEGTLDQFDYQRILTRSLYPQANRLWGKGVWILLQDGATCHTAHTTLAAIQQQAGDIIAWPSASPDLNPMENVWAILHSRVAKRNPRTIEELKLYIGQEWQRLDNDEAITIAESMPNRVSMLIETEGAYTGY